MTPGPMCSCIPGGSRGTWFWAGDGALRETESTLPAAAPADSPAREGLYVLELGEEREVTFRLDEKGMARGNYEAEVLRWPVDRLGEEGLTLEDGWPVPFWESPMRDGEHRDTMYFQAVPGYYYTVVLSWGEGSFASSLPDKAI